MPSRREFIVQIAGAAVALHGCGGGSDPDPTPPGGDPTPEPDAGTPTPTPTANCSQNGAGSVIGDNHGHVFMVPAADVRAGAQRIYDITGSADHPHTVTLSATQMQMLARNEPFMITTSSDDGHTHTVRLFCITA